jgi:rhodanese-related sulfurtransferase
MLQQPKRYHDLAGTLRTALLQALLLTVIGVLIAAVFNAYRQDALKWSGVGRLPAGYAQESGAFETITMDNALSRYEEGKILFIDARDSSAFLSGHLPGAYNVPPEKARSSLEHLERASLSGKALVIYCEGPGCDLSFRLASALARQGISGIGILPAGWAGWYEAGFPIEEGEGS